MTPGLRTRARSARHTLWLRVVALVALIALVAVLSLVWNSVRYRQELRQQAAAAAEHAADRIAQAIDRALGLGLGYAELVAGDPGVRNGDPLACQALVDQLAATEPSYASFGVNGTDGSTWCRSPRDAVEIPRAGTAWFQQVLEAGESVLGGFTVLTSGGASLITAAAPVIRDGRTVAVASVDWSTAALEGQPGLDDLPAGARVLVVDHDGVVVTELPGGPAVGSRLSPGSAALRAITNHASGAGPVVDDEHLHVARVAGHAAVVLQIPTAAIYEPATARFRRSFTQTASTLALGLLLLLVALDRWILRPVAVMNDTVFRIAGGDLDARTGLSNRDDEVGTLASAVDAMATDLGRQRAETERLSAQLAERSEQLRMLMDHSPSPVLLLDPDGRFIAVSKRAAAVLQRPAAEVVGRHFEEVVPGPFAQRLGSRLEEVRRGVPVREDDTLVVRGEERIYDTDLFPIFDREGAVVAIGGIAAEVTERRRHAAELERVAATDALTGLANRSAFTSHVQRVLALADRGEHLVAVGYLDLDGFKAINDTFGHETGDDVLIAVARRLAGVTRAGELVARLGGDEFTLCFDRVADVEAVRTASARVLSVFEEPFRAGDGVVQLAASMGIAVAPQDGRDAETLLRAADRAMYAAKRSGRHGVRFAL